MGNPLQGKEFSLKSSNSVAVLVTVVVLALTGAGWVFLPNLQSGPRQVEAQAGVHVERARRMLDRYNAQLAYRSLVLDQLRDAEIPVDPQDAGEIAEKIGDEYQIRHSEMWKLYKVTDWKDGVGREAKPSYGNLAGQIREGLTARTKLAKENAALLDEAVKEIEEGLRVQAGGASGSEYAEALRLQSVALFHRGSGEQMAARIKREDLLPLLSELDALSNEGEQLKAMEGILAGSKIDEQIEVTREELSKAQARVAKSKEELAKLDATIHELERKLAAAQARTKTARAEIDRLRGAGVDFSDPNGAAKFAQKLGEQDIAYRAALREAQELEAGSLPKAEIDITGDFLRGKYLENGERNLTVQPGLRHYQAERATLAVKIELEQAGVNDIQGDLARLEEGRKPYEEQQAAVAKRLPEIQAQAGKVYEELSRVESEAEAIEERGIKALDQSAVAAQQAAALIDKWMAEGRESVANLGPEAKERVAGNSRADDAWIAGFITAQGADARTAKAWIYYDRFNAANRIAQVLERVTNQVALREVDISAERTKADEAKEAAVKEVELAMTALEKAHKSTDRNWTVAAQGAGVTYLMVLLGHEDYLADTVEGYRNAVKGREGDRAAEAFVNRLKFLEAVQR